MQNLPAFKVLKRAEQPPESGYHIPLVHRFNADKTCLVHDITGRIAGDGGLPDMTGAEAFTGTPGEALRKADMLATEHAAPTVYVRDDT